MKWIIVLFIVSFSVCGEDIDKFYNYVVNEIEKINNHTRPINNSDLYNYSDANIYDGGSFDFIIVGGGSAGTVLASRLSEIFHWKILLLEAGGPETDYSDVPGFAGSLPLSDMDWGYLTTPQKTCCQGMLNNQCVYPRGKVFGGSSTTNIMVYTRGNKEDFNEWESLGNPNWGYDKILQYFKKSEKVDFNPYDKYYRSSEGCLHVNYTAPPTTAADAYVKSAEELGFRELDINAKDQIGFSKMQFNINFNKRCSGSHAFIDPIREVRKNLTIELRAFTVKILIKGSNAVGVQYVKNNKIYKAKALKEVILSAGAINSPQLLLLSGIGPSEELNRLGIKVVKNLPAVGRNMQDHPHFINLAFRTNLLAEDVPLKERLIRYLDGKAPLTRGLGAEYITYLNTLDLKSPIPDIEYITVTPSKREGDNQKGYNLKNNIAKAFQNYNPLTDLSIIILLLRPKSTGSVTLKSKSPLDFPLIDVNYFSDPNNEDIDTMYRGIKFMLNFTKTDGFKKINATYISEQPDCEHLLPNNCQVNDFKNNCDKDYWYCAIRHYSSTTFHPTGTARMGVSPKDNVVDHNCLVYGFKNLRVVDASVMPTIVRAHTNAAVYMIAEKISDHIKSYHTLLEVEKSRNLFQILNNFINNLKAILSDMFINLFNQ